MNSFSAVVLYAMIWFVTVFVVLPIRARSQAEEGEIVPGTHAGAPANFRALRMMRQVTIYATLTWMVVAGIILFSGMTIRDIDMFNKMESRPLSQH